MQKTLSLLGYSWVSGIPLEKIEEAALGRNALAEEMKKSDEVSKDFLDKYFDVTVRPVAKGVKIPVRKDLEEWIIQRNKRSMKQ